MCAIMSTGGSDKSVDLVSRLIALARDREEQNLNTYEIYGEITENSGLRNLLASLETNIRSHLEKLEEIEASLREEDFEPAKLASVSLPEDPVEYAFDAGMSYRDFLLQIHRRESASADVYGTLASVTAEAELRFEFERLAEDGRKHMWLVKTRADLEALD